MIHIQEFMGRITIKYNDYKIDTDTLSHLVEQALDQGSLYPEKLGKDKLQTLVLE